MEIAIDLDACIYNLVSTGTMKNNTYITIIITVISNLPYPETMHCAKHAHQLPYCYLLCSKPVIRYVHMYDV